MRACLQCGCELPADAPKDLCPKCLMGAAFGFAPIANGGAAIPGLDFPAETPERIGSYKILEKLGEGGCGIVYLAEQEEPIRRRVALKLIKLGMDTRQVIARFEAERQALALMNHPNVAKVLNAGASETGRPYFVMELVRGSKITEYCDKYYLSTRERLELFLQVCRAIEHAHQKGIIHRDIKPSNILVTQQDGKAVPMVIDFGIAKATGGQPLTNKTLHTGLEQVIGTPAYMSPEQAERKWDVDTRTDIYSLGVVLYELLTGKTPFDSNDLLSGGWDVIRRKICETEPQTPSTRLTTLAPLELNRIAKCRRVEVPKLIHGVRGDLDWIAMKCLEKEPSRRYETCNAIASDVERHMNEEPVVARPAGNAYRFRKLVSRNRVLVSAVLAVMIALLLGTATSTWFFVKERAAKVEAQKLRRQAEVAEEESEEREKRTNEKAVRLQKALDVFEETQIRRKPLNEQSEWPADKTRLDSTEPNQNQPSERDRSSSYFPAQIPANLAEMLPPPQLETNSLVVSPQQFKLQYTGWAQQWWKWMMELPLTDESGIGHPFRADALFDVNQNVVRNQNVWFLGSPFGSHVRECVIPQEVYLFIGMVNAECSDLENAPFIGATQEQRAAGANELAELIVDLYVEVNGKAVDDPYSFRVASPDIKFNAPTPWIFTERGGRGKSSADGYYLMLYPLPPGEHIIYWRGAFDLTPLFDVSDLLDIDPYYFIETTYRITVPF
jgi:serine/threonine protein kinase